MMTWEKKRFNIRIGDGGKNPSHLTTDSLCITSALTHHGVSPGNRQASTSPKLQEAYQIGTIYNIILVKVYRVDC